MIRGILYDEKPIQIIYIKFDRNDLDDIVYMLIKFYREFLNVNPYTSVNHYDLNFGSKPISDLINKHVTNFKNFKG